MKEAWERMKEKLRERVKRAVGYERLSRRLEQLEKAMAIDVEAMKRLEVIMEKVDFKITQIEGEVKKMNEQEEIKAEVLEGAKHEKPKETEETVDGRLLFGVGARGGRMDGETWVMM